MWAPYAGSGKDSLMQRLHTSILRGGDMAAPNTVGEVLYFSTHELAWTLPIQGPEAPCLTLILHKRCHSDYIPGGYSM